MQLKSIFGLLKTAVTSWIQDFAPSMGAALAYYTVFSVAPLLVVVIAVVALILGQQGAQAEILDQLNSLLGPEASKAIEVMLVNAQRPKEGIIASAIGIVALLIGATTVFAEIESDLNRVWKVKPDKKSGVWSFVRARVLSFGLVVALGFLLLVSLLVSAALAAWGKHWSGWFGDMHLLLEAANMLLSLAVTTALFAIVYKVLPSAEVRWRDVWIGSLVTAVLFVVGKYLIGLYIGTTAVASGYGAAGALVVLLVWVYYSAQIFLIGAEFTHAYAASHDRGASQISESTQSRRAVAQPQRT